MEDALAIIGQWIGLVKSAKLSIAEVSQDCEARVAAGRGQCRGGFSGSGQRRV